jgi:peptidyl-prolyl cis-trans isomerase A (cyclophilin A)
MGITLSAAIALAAPALAQTQPPATKPAAPAPAPNPALRTPAKLKETAPATFRANFDTTAGQFVVEVTRTWSPLGADRFYNLVKNGFFDDTRFFRVMRGFMVQFGIHGNPAIQKFWANASIPDDKVTQSNRRGFISFATRGPNTRTTQVFINFGDNAALDGQGFSPFGRVVTGMEVVDKINAQYGEQPEQPLIQSQGNRYLDKTFPKLDKIIKATIAK